MIKERDFRRLLTNPVVLPTLGDYPRRRKMTVTAVINGDPTMSLRSELEAIGRPAWLVVRRIWSYGRGVLDHAPEGSFWFVEFDDTGAAAHHAPEDRRMGIRPLLSRLREHPAVINVNLGRVALEELLTDTMYTEWGSPWGVTYNSVKVEKSVLGYTLSFVEEVSGEHVVIEPGHLRLKADSKVMPAEVAS